VQGQLNDPLRDPLRTPSTTVSGTIRPDIAQQSGRDGVRGTSKEYGAKVGVASSKNDTQLPPSNLEDSAKPKESVAKIQTQSNSSSNQEVPRLDRKPPKPTQQKNGLQIGSYLGRQPKEITKSSRSNTNNSKLGGGSILRPQKLGVGSRIQGSKPVVKPISSYRIQSAPRDSEMRTLVIEAALNNPDLNEKYSKAINEYQKSQQYIIATNVLSYFIGQAVREKYKDKGIQFPDLKNIKSPNILDTKKEIEEIKKRPQGLHNSQYRQLQVGIINDITDPSLKVDLVETQQKTRSIIDNAYKNSIQPMINNYRFTSLDIKNIMRLHVINAAQNPSIVQDGGMYERKLMIMYRALSLQEQSKDQITFSDTLKYIECVQSKEDLQSRLHMSDARTDQVCLATADLMCEQIEKDAKSNMIKSSKPYQYLKGMLNLPYFNRVDKLDKIISTIDHSRVRPRAISAVDKLVQERRAALQNSERGK